jgi:hypothetical protein
MDLNLRFKAQEVVAALGEINDGDVLVLHVLANLREEYGGALIAGEDVVIILAK